MLMRDLPPEALRRLLARGGLDPAVEQAARRVLGIADGSPDRAIPRPPSRERLRAEAPPPVLPPDGGVRLVLYGPPRTKKNHGQRRMIGDQLKTLASEAWYAWVDALRRTAQLPPPGWSGPLTGPVNCAAVFYRDRASGDLVGYQQGLADVLEKLGAIENDAQIQGWDGSRLAVDTACPRVELRLGPLTGPSRTQ